jgi:hypothetical protein
MNRIWICIILLFWISLFVYCLFVLYLPKEKENERKNEWNCCWAQTILLSLHFCQSKIAPGTSSSLLFSFPTFSRPFHSLPLGVCTGWILAIFAPTPQPCGFGKCHPWTTKDELDPCGAGEVDAGRGVRVWTKKMKRRKQETKPNSGNQ